MPSTSSHRPLLAAATGAVVLALCAVPLFWTAVFAIAGFTGCFLGCSEPEPAVGALWGGIALLLGSAPVAAGALAGGYRVGAAAAVGGVVTVALLVVLVIGHAAL